MHIPVMSNKCIIIHEQHMVHSDPQDDVIWTLDQCSTMHIPVRMLHPMQASLQLQATCTAEHHLGVEVKLEQVVQVPVRARVVDSKHLVDLDSRKRHIWDQTQKCASGLDNI